MTPTSRSKTPPKLTRLELYMLLVLTDESRHGYGIKLEVERLSEGRVRLGSGTLYAAMDRLEQAGLLRSRAGRGTGGREKMRRRYYRLSGTGRAALRDELIQLDSIVSHAKQLRLIVDRETA